MTEKLARMNNLITITTLEKNKMSKSKSLTTAGSSEPLTSSVPPVHSLDTRVEPLSILKGIPTSVVVRAFDHVNNNPISGKVFIDNIPVGDTNTPFNYTFNSAKTGTIKAPLYRDTPIYFSPDTLLVTANPDTIELGKPVQITIYAQDPKTHAPVAGKVLSNELPNQPEIGSTNTVFTHTFIKTKLNAAGDLRVPRVGVVAPGYGTYSTPVIIKWLIPPCNPYPMCK